jgi:hypothetical protein
MSKKEPEKEKEPKETQAVMKGKESLKSNIPCRYGSRYFHAERI